MARVKMLDVEEIPKEIDIEVNEDGLQYNGLIMIRIDNDIVFKRVNTICVLLVKVNKDEIEYGNDRRFVNMTPY